MSNVLNAPVGRPSHLMYVRVGRLLDCGEPKTTQRALRDKCP